MMSFGRLRRIWQIRSVASRYGLQEFIGRKPGRDPRPRGVRLRLALEELGPVFIKFGQALSTRPDLVPADIARSEEHTSELQSLMRISYDVCCLKKNTNMYEQYIHNYTY